jgi:hypothetical protein
VHLQQPFKQQFKLLQLLLHHLHLHLEQDAQPVLLQLVDWLRWLLLVLVLELKQRVLPCLVAAAE